MIYLIYIFPLILISIVVFIHELGHFSFARLFGVRVLDFSIGFENPSAAGKQNPIQFSTENSSFRRICSNE